MPEDTPDDIAAIRGAIEDLLNQQDEQGRVVGNARFGVYAFYDYEGEPIYVGQTKERLRTRIRRHLTNQRTDAVAMNVLDPFEVAEIEMWPLWELENETNLERIDAALNAAEYAVFQKAVDHSKFHAVLNEADIPEMPLVDLPASWRGKIIPNDLFDLRKHPDVRIARRAQIIAALAKVISERQVSKGLRRTLVTQARRLETLARERLEEVGGSYPVEVPGEETGEEAK